MPTVIQGDSVNLLPGIVRLTGMTAILSALSIPQGYGSALPYAPLALDPASPFAAFDPAVGVKDTTASTPKVSGLKGTVPLTAVLAMKPQPFTAFYEVTGIADHTLPQTTKAALAERLAARQKAEGGVSTDTPATATIERFIDSELSSDKATVPFDHIAHKVDEALEREANPRLVVSRKNGKTTFNRDTLTIYEDQDHVQLDVDHQTLKAIEQGQMAVFIRNPDILAFDKQAMRLITKGRGNTELYFVSGSESMAIIPVAVEGFAGTVPALSAAPKQLASLNHLLASTYPQQEVVARVKPKAKIKAKASANVKTKAAPALVAKAEPAAALVADLAERGITAAELPKTSIKSTGTLLASAAPMAGIAPAAKPAAAAVDEAELPKPDRRFAHSGKGFAAGDITIKVGDERSELLAPGKPRLYPISGLSVKVIGSKDRAITGATGEITLADVPAAASFLIAVDDPRGKFAPAIIEVAANRGSKERVKLLSQKNLSIYSDLAGAIQKSWLGSACITVKAEPDADGLVEDVSGLTVAANTGASSPLYFSKNLPRPNKVSLDSHGRFCFFNIEPGLVELGLKDENGQWLTGFALPIFAGKHLEDDITIGAGRLLRTQVAAVPSGKAQLHNRDIALEDYAPVDSAELLALGDQAEFDSSLPSFHSLAPGYSAYKGRVFVLAKGGDMETALYNFPAPSKLTADMPVLPALPRGFIEDLHNDLYEGQSLGAAGSLFEPSLGSAVVFFGHYAKLPGSVTIKLLDDRGREVNTGWYFGESDGTPIKGRTPEGLSKAVFFNLNPGIYTAVVETEDGQWLDSDTIAVDYWTTSVVSAGSQIRSWPR